MSYPVIRLLSPWTTFLLSVVASPLFRSPILAQTTPPTPQSNAPARAIILGQPQETPYVVVIPGSDFTMLEQIQKYAPLAFLSNSRMGSYIQAGAYTDRSAAEVLNRALRQQGWDARVVYMPVR
jgi:cell division protein FtsN